jgi:plasmid stability protein
MATLLISDVAETAYSRLHELAKAHGRTPEAEAKAILEEQLHSAPVTSVWAQVNAFRDRLAASNRNFGDSAELLREDRDR